MKPGSRRQIGRLILNNCKIANELRKYRDLAGCVNQVSLSAQRVRKPTDSEDYAEYFITQNLSYLDMAVANAAYTLMVSGIVQTPFSADVIGQIMTGDMAWRPPKKLRSEVEQSLQKLAGTELYILADHDHQVEPDLYEGAFLPIIWETAGERTKFQFLPEKQMPLYQYAEHHRQLIEVPFRHLRDDTAAGQTPHNNTSRMITLRHYLLQELEILLYAKNKVDEQQIRLLKKDREGNEFGLLWILGILDEETGQQVKDPAASAKRVHKAIHELLQNWEASGYLNGLQYEMLTATEGFGVRITPKAKA